MGQFFREKSQSRPSSPQTYQADQEFIQALMQNYPYYFEHKAGRCLCSQCSCGHCQVKCQQLSKHLDNHLKLNVKSSYQTDYQNKLQPQSLDNLAIKQLPYKESIETYPGEYDTTNKVDYQRYEYNSPQGIQKNQYVKNLAPLSDISSYKIQFWNWGAFPRDKIRQSTQKTTIDQLPFFCSTTYENDYKIRFKEPKREMILPRNMNPLPNIGIFLGESTTQRLIDDKSKNKNFQSTVYKNSKEAAVTIPAFQGQYISETTKAFEEKIHICQAREILKKRYQEHMENINNFKQR